MDDMTDVDLTYSATKLRPFLIRQLEARGYNCEWSLLSDVDVLNYAADLLQEVTKKRTSHKE